MVDPSHVFGTFAPSLSQRLLLALIRIPPLYRGSLRPFWVRVLNALRGGPVDVTSAFGLFRVYPTTNLVDSALLIHPCYNQAEIAFLREGLGAGSTFVDIGANIGLYSVALGNSLRGSGRVISIEPNPICVERLRANLRFNDLPVADVVPVAAGDAPGRGHLIIDRGDLAIARTVRDETGGDFEIRTLTHILDQAGVTTIAALKIDVEGFEMAALAPFFRDAPRARWPKRICIENLGRETDAMQMLAAVGYRSVGNTRNNALLLLG
jgi:FkbM family methyltransferase